ncbi:MAG: extracellular solute-binding protein [Oscillospiraceae bacterium]|nr:extracellular solute-binding protein [Oscillospiraceae bacterium]
MQTFKKRIVNLALAIVLLVSFAALAACGGSAPSATTAAATTQAAAAQTTAAAQDAATTAEATTAAAQQAGATQAAATTQAAAADTAAEAGVVGALDTWLCPELTTLKFLTHSGYSSSSSPPGNDLPKYIECERLTNVHIDFEVILNSEYNSIVNVRLASGADLPDIMTYNGNIALLSELVEDGILISQDDLYASCYPYTQALIAGDHPYANPMYETLMDIMKVNGVFYGATQIVPVVNMQQGLMVNKFWMENLDLPMPETVDEFYEMLIAFRDNDANGNGDPTDEIPLVTEAYCLGVIANYFGLEYGGSASGWKATDGVLTFERTDLKYREFLSYMNKLYRQDLLDADFLSTDRDAVNEYCANDKAGVVNWWLQSMDGFSSLSPYSGDTVNTEMAVYVPIPPLRSEFGGGVIYNRRGGTGSMMAITTSCKDPELAARWIDFMFAAPISMDMVAYGVEGFSYLREGDNIIKLYDDTGTWLREEAGGSQQPHAYLEFNINYMYATADQWKIDAWESLLPYYIESSVYGLQLLPDESQKLTDETPDLTTYIDESYTAFIVGTMDINDESVWNTYLETCNSLGLPTRIAIHQQAYDRKYK